MAWIDVQILYDGTDITNQVTSYDRDKSLCTSVGVARVSLKRNASITPVLYKKVVIIEGGHNKGTYWIHTIDRDIPSNTMTLNCQNGSIKLQDYFISESFLVDYASTSDYWIRKFMDDAKVSYSFDSGGTGTLLSNNTSLGMCTAMDAIVPLLQQNAWYLSFDANDVAHIGTLSIDTGTPKVTLDDDTIISTEILNHDRMFRNRAVVWGNANPLKHRWVYYDLDQHGKYSNEYPGGHDVRSVVIANGNIKEGSAAAWIAQKALKAFAHTQKEVTVDVAGAVDVDTGDFVYVNSRAFRGKGIVTTEGASLSESGFITHLVINQECPKLFSFYDYGGYIYVGTQGNGVWRKPLNVHTWSNFSTGLTDLNITDLAVDSGAFASVSQGGTLFIRTDIDTAWRPFVPTLVDTLTYSGQSVTYPTGSGMATTCTFDKDTGDIIAGFSLRIAGSGDPARSWLYYIHDATHYTSYQLQDEQGLTEFSIVDLDNNGTDDLVSVQIHASGTDLLFNDLWHGGSYSFSNQDKLTVSGVIASGYMNFPLQDGTVQHGFYTESQNTCGDGQFVYSAESMGWPGVGIFDPSYTITEVREIDTTGGATEQLHIIETDHDASTSLGGFFQAIGNRRIAWVERWNTGGVKYQPVHSTLHSYSFITSEHISHDLLESEIPADYYPLATIGKASGPTGRYYVLFGDSKISGNLILGYYDFDNQLWHRVATGAIPLTLMGGVSPQTDTKELRGMASGDLIAFIIGGVYSNVDIEGSPTTCNWPIVVYYYQGTGTLWINSGAPSVMNGLGGVHALEWSSYDGHAGILGDVVYAGVYVSGDSFLQDCLFEFGPNGYCTSRYGTATHRIKNAVGTKSSMYFVLDDGTGTALNLLNAQLHAVERIFPINNNKTNVIGQQDDGSGSFFVYNPVNGHVTKYPASGVGSEDYSFGAIVDYTGVGDSFSDFTEDHSALVGDIFYLKSFIGKDTGTFNPLFWGQTTTYAIYPSGERLMPRPYSILPGEGCKVLQGYRENSYMTVLESSDTPFHIDASSNFPWAVWGGKSYSGMTFSGFDPWGWNQSQLWVSSDGGPNTYTSVVLNALNSYITDLRSCNMYSGYVDPDNSTYNRYLVFPQPTTNLPGAGGSNLLLVDMSSVYNIPGAIITSGSLNQYCTILEVFNDYIDHVETTNTQDSPYIFVSKSGVPTKFYQRDGYSTMDFTIIPASGFIDRTTNLPTGYAINCIRADDQI